MDRFTGSTIDGALMETEPVWSKTGENFILRLRIDNYKNHEATLLLHLLKDLWTGDLPIGGEKSIGRGVLKGIEATLYFDKETVCLKQTKEGLQISPSSSPLAKFNSLEPHSS